MNHPFELKYFVKKYADSNWHLENPSIPFCDLTFILDGEAVYRSGGQVCTVRSGEAIFLPAGSDRYAQTNGMQCAAFSFTAPMLHLSGAAASATLVPHLAGAADSAMLTPHLAGAAKFKWYNDLTLNGYFNEFNQSWFSKSEIDLLKCDGLFLLIISRLMELQQTMDSQAPSAGNVYARQNPHVARMKDYIHKHLTDKITVQTVADHVKLNPVYCGSLFSKETGETILNYTNRLRIIRSKELLQYTNDPISQIAADVGIDDLFYFSRVFKKIAGVSPQQYRSEMLSCSNN